jgi:hypothetical protein
VIPLDRMDILQPLPGGFWPQETVRSRIPVARCLRGDKGLSALRDTSGLDGDYHGKNAPAWASLS